MTRKDIKAAKVPVFANEDRFSFGLLDSGVDCNENGFVYNSNIMLILEDMNAIEWEASKEAVERYIDQQLQYNYKISQKSD